MAGSRSTWRGTAALTRATVRSDIGLPCRIRYGDRLVELTTEPGGRVALDAGLRPAP